MWAAARLAGAILHRHRTIRPGAAKHVPAGLGHTAPRRSELVLAGVSSPAQPRLYSAEQMAQMAAPGALSPDQFIPPLPPVDSGFSAGQRIPPMPKIDKKKQPSGQKPRPDTKPKPAAAQKPARKRIYSRVEEVLSEKPAMQPDPAPPETAETEPAAGPQLQTDLPPGTAQTMPGPEAAGESSERDAQKTAPPAGLQVEPSAETGHEAAPEPAIRRNEGVQPGAPTTFRPTGPQVVPRSETALRPEPETPSRVQITRRPDESQRSQPFVEPETAPDEPVQRRTSPLEPDAPQIFRPAGPQQVQHAEISRSDPPETWPRQKSDEQPEAARGPQPFVESETAPDEPVQRRTSPLEPDAPQIFRPAGPQQVQHAEISRSDPSETRPRQKSDEQPDAARQPQPFMEPETAPDEPLQRRVSPPEPDAPAALRPTGPQTVPQTETGLRHAPKTQPQERQPDAGAGQPEKIFTGIPEKAGSTAAAQIDTGAGQPATRGKRGPEQADAASAPRQSPAEAAVTAQAEELPATHPHSGPESLPQPATPTHLTGPEPKPSEAASPNLERDIRRRAVAHAKLPLHRPRSAPGPQPINRHGGAVPGGHGVQRLFRPAGSQSSGMPQPLPGAEPPGRPSLPEQLSRAGDGRQPVFGAPAVPEPSAPPAPPPRAPGPAGSGHPHLAALRAIEQHFGQAAVVPAQERLAGLAGLGQPKTNTPPRQGLEAVMAQPEEKPDPQPFDINNISLGQPKVKVVRRQPSQNGTAANTKTRPAPAGRISRGRSPLVLARKPGRKGGGSAPAQSQTRSADRRAPRPAVKTRLIQPDLSRLAQAVYPLVKRLIAIERERHPGY